MTNIELIANILDDYQVNSYYQPSTDEFFSEYTPEYLNRLKWLTGFTGSNGSLIITKNEKIFFTDGRYTEQAKIQLSRDFIIFDLKDKLPWDYAKENNLKIGFNPSLLPCEHKFSNFRAIPDLVDLLWFREGKKESDIFFYDHKYQGYNYEEKVKPLLEMMSANNLTHYVMTNPDLICWLTSIRARDLEYTPLVLCYAIITLESEKSYCTIYSNNYNWPSSQAPKNIVIKDLSFFEVDINNFKNIGFDGKYCSYKIAQILADQGKQIANPLFLTRAVKHPVEIEYARDTHIKDAVAMCELLSWVEDNVAKSIDFDEVAVAKKSEEFRSHQEGYFSLSFPTIAGFASNSSIIHYKPEPGKCKKITSDSVLLIDSGGQYLGGTTDITRTIIFREASKEEKIIYTLVLMGHIDLVTSSFDLGETGKNMDQIARSYLKLAGLDYPHSTGHGVANFLGVHETPPSFSLYSQLPLAPGMVISNEPGCYQANIGVRIENLITVVKKNNKLSFEDLTLVPHEDKLIYFPILKKQHMEYLLSYYQKINDLVLPRLVNSKKAHNWLQNKLRKLIS